MWSEPWVPPPSRSELSRRRRALPERVADEERAERLDVLRGLDGLPHGLHEVRKGMEVAAHETDDEIVVVDVEPVAGEADVVGEVGVAVGVAEHAVLADDLALLLPREPREGARAAQRVPDGPGPGRVQRRPPRPAEQPLVEVLLESRRVRPAEHRELGLRREPREGLGVQELAETVDEKDRVLVEREDAHAAWVVRVLVERGLDPARLERPDERLRVEAVPEGVELDVQPALGRLLLGAALPNVDLRRVGRAHAFPPRGASPRGCASPGA